MTTVGPRECVAQAQTCGVDRGGLAPCTGPPHAEGTHVDCVAPPGLQLHQGLAGGDAHNRPGQGRRAMVMPAKHWALPVNPCSSPPRGEREPMGSLLHGQCPLYLELKSLVFALCYSPLNLARWAFQLPPHSTRTSPAAVAVCTVLRPEPPCSALGLNTHSTQVAPHLHHCFVSLSFTTLCFMHAFVFFICFPHSTVSSLRAGDLSHSPETRALNTSGMNGW